MNVLKMQALSKGIHIINMYYLSCK